MLAISTAGARIARLDNVRPAHGRQTRLIEALKLERSSQCPCSEASIMFISGPHDRRVQFLRPTGGRRPTLFSQPEQLTSNPYERQSSADVPRCRRIL